MSETREMITQCAAEAPSRLDLWTAFVRRAQVAQMAEIGVYRGDFAAALLRACPALTDYYLLDPWRHLSDWHKPANTDDARFEQYLAETEAKTAFAGEKRHFLRGRTSEVIDQIGDGQLDLAYIDGDHTLRGITIDLVRVYPKIRAGGWLGGDDFSRTIWQHHSRYEPTLVFPFAVYFAEAVGATIYGLPHDQFLLHKTADFAFVDLTGTYREVNLRHQFVPRQLLGRQAAEWLRPLRRLVARLLGR